MTGEKGDMVLGFQLDGSVTISCSACEIGWLAVRTWSEAGALLQALPQAYRRGTAKHADNGTRTAPEKEHAVAQITSLLHMERIKR